MENTPRNVVVQLGSLITLYVSVSFFLTLIFGIINLIYPDAADSYYQIESASDSVRLGIAMLIVFFPAYIALTRATHLLARHNTQNGYSQLAKWLIYLSLLIAGLTLLGTLVTTLYTFLNGDITTRFLMKAATVLCIVGMSFHYYLLEAKSYWISHESKSFMYAVGTGLVVLLALAFGFRYIEAPAAVREMKLDEQQVNDLRSIQYQIQNTLSTASSTLPKTLTEAYADTGSTAPTAPDGRSPYTYNLTAKGFELCATFSRSHEDPTAMTMPVDPMNKIKNADSWNYQAGLFCFERSIK